MRSLMVMLFILFLGNIVVYSQGKTENLVVVTLDGLRWQELFGGADSALLVDKNFTRDSTGTSDAFWDAAQEERRKKLFPFIWNTVASHGQVYGNRWKGSEVNNANKYWFSYPGYNEIFTGYPDTLVNSNDKNYNKNVTVLEYISKQTGFKNKVAAFCTWDVFPYILNDKRSGVYVNADRDSLPATNASFKLINDLQQLSPRPIDVRPDVLTYIAAREYLKVNQPRVLYIGFDETDDFAHSGMYDQYLKSSHAQDGMIADLWNYLQSSAKYRNKTTLIITCDHGRGDDPKENWQHHGSKIPDAGQIWIAVIGPDTKNTGEISGGETLYQQQLAATFAKLLGLSYSADHPIAPPIEKIYK